MREIESFQVEAGIFFLREPLVPRVLKEGPRFRAWFWEGDHSWSDSGRSRPEAIQNLSNRIAHRFCELCFLSPEDRENDDAKRTDWATLQFWIDVPRTLGSWPIRVKQTVEVLSADPWRVLPVGGVEAELALQNAPAGFENLKAGNWITATCVYDRTTHELVAITDMKQREPMAKLSAEQAAEFLRTMRKTSELPSLEWDEI